METMRRPGSLLLLAGLAVCGGMRAAAADQAAALQVLLKSFEPLDTTYTGEQVSEVIGGPGRARPQVQQVYRKGGTLRVNFQPSGQVLYDDGASQVLYRPRLNVYEKTPSKLGRLRQQAKGMRGQLRRGQVTLELLPDETVAGRGAHVVFIKHLGGRASRKVWIDRETYVQLRQDVIQPDGRTVSTYFRRIDFQDDPSPSVMAFTVPATAQLVERGQGRPLPLAEARRLAQSWGGPLLPKYMLPGYRFRGYFRHDFNGREALVAVYGKPGAKEVLSIFQGPVMGMAGMVEKKENLRVLTARKGQADVMVVGPSDEPLLEKVMGSL